MKLKGISKKAELRTEKGINIVTVCQTSTRKKL